MESDEEKGWDYLPTESQLGQLKFGEEKGKCLKSRPYTAQSTYGSGILDSVVSYKSVSILKGEIKLKRVSNSNTFGVTNLKRISKLKRYKNNSALQKSFQNYHSLQN